MVCKRAGSIETFPNIQAIIEYTKLIKQRSKSCSIDDGKAKREYAICHKVPVQNFLVMGFTNSKNLFIGRSDQNAKAGNVLHPDLLEDKSLYLNRSKLDPRYLIDGMTSKEILVLLYNRFGHDLLNHIVKENHPKRPKKSSALPCDLNKSGRDIASVLGASIFTHFGSDTETALKLFSTALIESHFIKSISGNGMSSTLSNRFLIGPWIIIQDLLQTGDMFTCKYLQFDYVPLKPTLEYWDYEMPSLPCSNSQPV
ncbi:MAG: hypothetical protein COA90_07895 [Gammaproteobacteria bacterium]|nr:MAG: hypothetical protein COA90_07895 [Gammaproteobacteria bacterium]